MLILIIGDSRMNTCPKCDHGRMVIRVQTAGENDFQEVPIGCIHCDGKGVVSDQKLSEIEEHDRFVREDMCGCDNPTFGSYPTDGQCDCGVHKHHVHCGTCEKISQIG